MESGTFSITWVELAAICTILLFVGGLMVAAAKTIFVTEKRHEKTCSRMQDVVNKKLDTLQAKIDEIERKREAVRAAQQRKEAWLVQSLQRIADKVGADISDIPS